MRRHLFLPFCMVAMLLLAACGNVQNPLPTELPLAEPSGVESGSDLSESKLNIESAEQFDADTDLPAQSEAAPQDGVPSTKPSEHIAAPPEEQPQSSPQPNPKPGTPQPSVEHSSVPSTPEKSPPATEETIENPNPDENTEMKLNLQIGGNRFTATVERNAAADALVELLQTAPVAIAMHDYSGFEKVGSLGTSLPTDNSQITTQSGDIVLYNGSQIVIFYGSNAWSYTRLAKIDDLTGWEAALGSGDVTVTFSLE